MGLGVFVLVFFGFVFPERKVKYHGCVFPWSICLMKTKETALGRDVLFPCYMCSFLGPLEQSAASLCTG